MGNGNEYLKSDTKESTPSSSKCVLPLLDTIFSLSKTFTPELPTSKIPDSPFFQPRKQVITVNPNGRTVVSSYALEYPQNKSNTQQSTLATDTANVATCTTTLRENSANLKVVSKSNLVRCYNCDTNCQKAALIKCDFCENVFHADCLDPPLSGLPATAWMCPLHPHHTLENKLLPCNQTNERISAKVKLWNEYSAPEIPKNESILSKFFGKIKNQPMPHDQPMELSTSQVPLSIKQAYQNRLARVPVEINTQPGFSQLEQPLNVNSNYQPPTKEQQRAYLQSMLLFQSEISRRLWEDITCDNSNEAEKSQGEDQEIFKKPVVEAHFDIKTDHGYSQSSLNQDENDINLLPTEEDTQRNRRLSSNDGSFSSGGSSDTMSVDSDEPDSELPFLDGPSCSTNSNCLTDYKRLEKRDSSLPNLLLPKRAQQFQLDTTKISPMNSSVARTLKKCQYHFGGKSGYRAIICPVLSRRDISQCADFSTKMKPIFHRSFSIGTSDSCNLWLNDYRRCNYVSPKHAVICFNEVRLDPSFYVHA